MENIVSSYPNHYPLIRKLESIAPLSDDEKQCVLSLPLAISKFDADQFNLCNVRPSARSWGLFARIRLLSDDG